MSQPSTISSSTVIVGRVTASTDLEVHGRVEGSIDASGDVVITDGARIKSDVSGKSVTVSGAVAGNVAGQDVVVLESGARVVGDISAPSIGIRAGALVRGRIETGAPGTTKPRRAPAATARRESAPAAKSAKPARAKKKAPAPVMPKAAGRAKKKSSAKKSAKKAPAPVVPAIKRSKKTAKRRSR